MLKTNIVKMAFVLAMLFVGVFSCTTVSASDINLDHKGKIIINLESVETGEKLESLTVHLYKIATIDESSSFVASDPAIDITLSASQLLNTIKSLDLRRYSYVSNEGKITFDNLDLGIYLVEIPKQTLNSVIYVSEPFTIEMPTKKNGNYSYLVEATPKINIDVTDDPVVPQTSSQSNLLCFLLVVIGALLTIIGTALKRRKERKND